MFTLDPSHRLPFDRANIDAVPRRSGVYVVYDLAGPIYAGRSGVDIHRRLQSHFDGKGNRNLALARRVGAGPSLTFTYCLLPPGRAGERRTASDSGSRCRQICESEARRSVRAGSVMRLRATVAEACPSGVHAGRKCSVKSPSMRSPPSATQN